MIIHHHPDSFHRLRYSHYDHPSSSGLISLLLYSHYYDHPSSSGLISPLLYGHYYDHPSSAGTGTVGQ
jgi:hypothetical protein